NSADDKTAVIRNGKAMWLTEFTHDRAQLESALARIPALVAPPEAAKKETGKTGEKNKEQQSTGSMTVSSDSNQKKDETATAKSKDDEVLERETIKAKNGAVITRTIKKDGTIDVKRVSSSGHMTIQLDNFYDMAAATRDAAQLAR